MRIRLVSYKGGEYAVEIQDGLQAIQIAPASPLPKLAIYAAIEALDNIKSQLEKEL